MIAKLFLEYNFKLNKNLIFSTSTFWHLFACGLVALTVWIAICLIMRYTLKLLLMYKGYMYEARGSGSKTSLKTKIWFVLVRGNYRSKALSKTLLQKIFSSRFSNIFEI